MTRFIYLADTHLGASPLGYYQQTPYPKKVEEILATLDTWIQQTGDIDFLIHGGDMVDFVSEDQIRLAADLFQLSIPVYLCLGNHDLTAEDSLSQWLAVAPEFFPGGCPEYLIETQDGGIYVMPNQWCETPYYWGNVQDPQFSHDQQTGFEENVSVSSRNLRVFVTHSPVFGLPSGQTKLPGPLHEPDVSFLRSVRSLIAPCNGVQCVAGAHNHMNMHIEKAGIHYVTVSAFVESPFEFKLFDMHPDQLSMTTISLREHLPFMAGYDGEKMFVQGRTVDRSFKQN